MIEYELEPNCQVWMKVDDVPRKIVRRVASLYRRGVRAVEICNLMFPELKNETDNRKRDFIWRLLQHHGLALTTEERGARIRMYSKNKGRKSWKTKSKWTTR